MTEEPAASRRAFLRGAAGTAAVAGGAGTAVAQEEGGEGGQSVTVELVNYAFEPGTDDPLTIPPGTTVNFVWTSDNHNIVVESQPSDAEWSGHETIENSGFEYSHTFEVTGTYEFFCQPHKSLGMVGTIVVEEGASLPGSGGGSGAPAIPDSAKTLGLATFVAMVTTLGLAFFFLKYGGDYEAPPE